MEEKSKNIMPKFSEQEEDILEEAEEQLDDTAAKAEEYLAGWQRSQADYANLKKEVERIREEMAKFACVGFLEKLLPVLDSFEKAGMHEPKTDDENVMQWIQGVGHVRGQFEKVLSSEGLTRIDDVDVPFDPHLHEAMLREDGGGKAIDTVLEILEPGYKIHNRVIRVAKVKVAQ